MPNSLICVECQCLSDERARGWCAYVTGADGAERDEVVVFCSNCAAREFGDGSAAYGNEASGE